MPSLISVLIGVGEPGARRALSRPLPAEPTKDPKAAKDPKVKQALAYEANLIKEAVAYIKTAKNAVDKAEKLKSSVRGGERTKLGIIVMQGLRAQVIERLLKSRRLSPSSDLALLIAKGKKSEQELARLKT